MYEWLIFFLSFLFFLSSKKRPCLRKNEKDAVFSILFLSLFAERQGFEPWDQQAGQRFSRPPRSTTPASLLGRLPLAENGCKITNKNPHGKIFLSKKRRRLLQPFDIKRNSTGIFSGCHPLPSSSVAAISAPPPTVSCRVSTGEDVYRETQRAASLQATMAHKRLPGDAARCVSTGGVREGAKRYIIRHFLYRSYIVLIYFSYTSHILLI